jgi:ribosome-binding protein aMBF1 (putative translation factor)
MEMAKRTKTDVTQGELVARELNADDDFRREWDKHAPARLVAAKLIEYRFDHELSQRALAEVLGVKQPQIARWESGESLPSADNLALIAGALDIEIVLSFAKADREPKQITKKTAERAAAYAAAGAVVRVAAD